MKYAPCGGVRGAPLTQEQIKRAYAAIHAMPKAQELDGSLKGQTVVVAGNSPTISAVTLFRLNNHPIIGCNRGLRYKGLQYTHIIVADRQPYCQERDSGHLAEFSQSGGTILGSDSLFDPTVLLRGPSHIKDRLAQPPPDFPLHVYKIGTLGQKNAQAKLVSRKLRGLQSGFLLNFDTFAKKVESCLNIAGSMIQAAMIMGAGRIVFVGIELKWPDKGPSHFFGNGRSVGAYPQNDRTVDYILMCMRWAKEEMHRRGVEVLNLSPVKDCPFASVFGNYPVRKFA